MLCLVYVFGVFFFVLVEDCILFVFLLVGFWFLVGWIFKSSYGLVWKEGSIWKILEFYMINV